MRRLGLRSDGSAMVEFALVLPVFLLAVLGLVYFGLLVWIHGSLQYAVEDAARCARVRPDICRAATGTPPNPETVTAYARARYFGVGNPQFDYSSHTPCGHRVVGTVTAPAADYIPLRLLGVSSSTLTAHACFPLGPVAP